MSGTGERPVQGASSAARRKRSADRPFLVNVHKLRARSGNKMELHLAGEIEELAYGTPEGEAEPVLGPLEGGSAVVPIGGIVTFEGWAESTPGGVTVAGEVSAPFVGVCRRCLGDATGRLSVEVRELFLDPKERPEAFEEEGADHYPVGPDELDVQPLVRDACILELPLAPLCSESCAGLCPTCGANLNEVTCSCEPEVDPRWAALAGLSEGVTARQEDDESQDDERSE